MIRRKKMTAFLDANESTYVSELKKMVRGITKKDVEDMKLLKDREVLIDIFIPYDYKSVME